jgi:hypothetical protein
VTCLLEQPGGPRLGLRNLLRGLLLGVLDRLARFALRRVQHLGALPLALLPVAVDLALPLLQVALATGHLLLRPPQLASRGRLRVALDRVGHLRGGADQVQRVHPHRVPGRLGATPRRLEHAQLHLELRRMPAEGLEGLSHPLAVVAVGGAREVLDARQRRQRGRLLCSFVTLGCHLLARLLARPDAGRSMTAVSERRQSFSGRT